MIGQRSPVVVSITTAAWFGSVYWPGSVIGTSPLLSNACCVETCGILTMIGLPGLKPSARLMSVGSTWTPLGVGGHLVRL